MNAFFEIENRLAAYFQMNREKEPKSLLLKEVGKPLNESEYLEKIYKTYTSNISKMASFANARGTKFLLVFQPELGNKKSISIKEQEFLKIWNVKYKYLDKEIQGTNK